MSIVRYLAFGAAFMSPAVLAAPVTTAPVTIEARQGAGIAGEAIGILDSLLSIFTSGYELINGIKEDEWEKQVQFVQSVLGDMRTRFPTKNVAIWHDQDTEPNFSDDKIHMHAELDLTASRTKGYEIWLFDSGDFTRAGDGGWINWGWAGNCEAPNIDSSYVVCQAIEETPTTTAPSPSEPMVPPPQPTRHSSNSGDGNYFVNCVQASTGTISSGVAYYANIQPGANVNQQPDDYVDASHGTHTTWEKPGSVTFGTGVTVSWSIFGNAGEASLGAAAGTADNGYVSFWVYRDAG